MSIAGLRAIAVIAAMGLLMQLGNAQQPPPPRRNTTFVAPDRVFQFSYPSDFQICARGKLDQCRQGNIPVCAEDALVCVLFPAKQFENPDFYGAGFEVREISRQELMTPDVCVTPYPRKDGPWPEFLVSAEHPLKTIGGLPFLHGVSAGAATSTMIRTDLYRVFHHKRCFELDVSQTGRDPHSFEPPRQPLTPAQQKELDLTMSYILHSFRFVN